MRTAADQKKTIISETSSISSVPRQEHVKVPDLSHVDLFNL